MCYSAEVSAGTFAFVALGTLYLWQRNYPLDRPIGLILLVIAGMQLVEFFLWQNLECGPANRFWTKMVPVALMIQPLLSLFIAWQWNAGWAPYYKEFFYLTAALFVPLIADFWQKLKGCTTLDEHGHLVWPKETFTLSPVAYWTYWFGTIYVNATLKDRIFSGIMVIFYFLSHHGMQAVYPKSWPSMWCQFANFLMVAAIARPYLYKA